MLENKNLIKNKIISNETKKKLSENNKGARQMNNGVQNKYIHRDKVEEYLSLGYKFGYIKY